jgi:hypothetical protein
MTFRPILKNINKYFCVLMSGAIFESGMLTNHGEKLDKKDIIDVMKLKIENISIQIIPLRHDMTTVKEIGKIIQKAIHPIFSPTLSHIAIQMTLEKNFYAIIEYGQYYTKDSGEIKKTEPNFFSQFFSGLKSFDDCRKENNKLTYYYINKDGARLTIYDNSLLSKLDENFDIQSCQRNEISRISLAIMASKYYGIKYEEFFEKAQNKDSSMYYSYIECDIDNKITLEDLCKEFEGEKWEAKNYNVVTHNCQNFADEVIKILKAKRIHDIDKVRTIEKEKLPNCIISTLWDNEKLSKINTLGRIPILGIFCDFFIMNTIKMPYTE